MVKLRTKHVGLPLLLMLAAVYVAPVAGHTRDLPSTQALPLLNEVNGDELKVGDIVAQGLRGEGGRCYFGAIRVRTTAPGNGKIQWLGIRLNIECQAVVDAKWIGSLEEGPSDIIEPLLRLLPATSLPVFENLQLEVENKSRASSANGMMPTKTSEQQVFMYGYGGQGDKLTKKTGKITFSYDGTNATLSSHSGSCSGSTPGYWSWVVDGCFLNGVVYGPASQVYRSGSGNYHCNPPGTFPCNLSNPDGYYHNLGDTEFGLGNGTSVCSYGYGGNTVYGVDRLILQGCS